MKLSLNGVKQLNWRILIILSLIISLSGAKIAMANENHQKAPVVISMDMKGQHDMSKMKKGDDMAGMDIKGDMSGMDMSGSNAKDSKSISHNDSNSGMKKGDDMSGMDMKGDMSGMDMSGSNAKDSKSTSHSDSHNKSSRDTSGMKKGDDMAGMDMGNHEPVKETPPNIKVLGTFGVINFSFIALGIWAKFFRRKGGSGGNTK
ncbi:MAG: hypothetical protein Q8906_01800 [Bacillota bacterium]|nr:hypothetical protein [Bacillota bacterium]